MSSEISSEIVNRLARDEESLEAAKKYYMARSVPRQRSAGTALGARRAGFVIQAERRAGNAFRSTLTARGFTSEEQASITRNLFNIFETHTFRDFNPRATHGYPDDTRIRSAKAVLRGTPKDPRQVRLDAAARQLDDRQRRIDTTIKAIQQKNPRMSYEMAKLKGRGLVQGGRITGGAGISVVPASTTVERTLAKAIDNRGSVDLARLSRDEKKMLGAAQANGRNILASIEGMKVAPQTAAAITVGKSTTVYPSRTGVRAVTGTHRHRSRAVRYAASEFDLAGTVDVVTPDELATSRNPVLQQKSREGKSFVSSDVEGSGRFIKSRGRTRIPISEARIIPDVTDATTDSMTAEENTFDAVLQSGTYVSRKQVSDSARVVPDISYQQSSSTSSPTIMPGKVAQYTEKNYDTRTFIKAYQKLTHAEKDAVDRYAGERGLTRVEATKAVFSSHVFLEKPDDTLAVTAQRKNLANVYAASMLMGMPSFQRGVIKDYAATYNVSPLATVKELGREDSRLHMMTMGLGNGAITEILSNEDLERLDLREKRVRAFQEQAMEEGIKQRLVLVSPTEQIELGLGKPYLPFVGESATQTVFDPLIQAGTYAWGAITGNKGTRKAASRKFQGTVDYYTARPYELGAELGSEAAFATVTGFGIGTAAKVALRSAPRIMAALQVSKIPKQAIPLTGKAETGLELVAARDIIVKSEIKAAINTSKEFSKSEKNLLLKQLKDVDKLRPEASRPVESGLEASHYRTLGRILKDASKPADERAADFNQYIKELRYTDTTGFKFKETGRIKDIRKKYGTGGHETGKSTSNMYQYMFDLDTVRPAFSEVAYRQLYRPVSAAKKTTEKSKQFLDDAAKWFGVGAGVGTQYGAKSTNRRLEPIKLKSLGKPPKAMEAYRETGIGIGTVTPVTPQREVMSSTMKLKPTPLRKMSPDIGEEYLDLGTNARQLQEDVIESRMYDPTRTILERPYSPKIFKPKTQSNYRIRDRTAPAELARLQEGMDQALLTPYSPDSKTRFRQPQSFDQQQLFDFDTSFDKPKSFDYDTSFTFGRLTPGRPKTSFLEPTFTYPDPKPIIPERVNLVPPTPRVPPLMPIITQPGIYIPPLRALGTPADISRWLRKWKVTKRPLAAAFSQFLPEYVSTGIEKSRRKGKKK